MHDDCGKQTKTISLKNHVFQKVMQIKRSIVLVSKLQSRLILDPSVLDDFFTKLVFMTRQRLFSTLGQ